MSILESETWREMVEYLKSEQCTKDLQAVQDRIEEEKKLNGL